MVPNQTNERVSVNRYLNLLTVEATAKGRGIGSAMLQECLIPYNTINEGV